MCGQCHLLTSVTTPKALKGNGVTHFYEGDESITSAVTISIHVFSKSVALSLCSLLALSPAWDWGIIVSCRHARRVRGLHPWCEMQPRTPQQPKIRSECQSRSRARAGDQEIQAVQCILQFLSCEWVFVRPSGRATLEGWIDLQVAEGSLWTEAP